MGVDEHDAGSELTQLNPTRSPYSPAQSALGAGMTQLAHIIARQGNAN